MNVGCVLKAAGKSRRFGKNKLFVNLAGKPILAYVLEALPREQFAKIVAVTSNVQVAEFCQGYGVESLLYEGGPVSETIRVGMGVMDGMDGCLFVSGDQPLCSRESFKRLLSAFEAEPDCVFRLSFEGIPGSPVLFPKRFFPHLCSLTGEQGGMTAVGKKEEIRFVSADFAAELMDVDTPQALAELEKVLKDTNKNK